MAVFSGSLGLDGGYVPFADYPADLQVDADSCVLLLKAREWVDDRLSAHPEAADSLQELRESLDRIAGLPRTTPAEAERVIHETVQAIHLAEQTDIDIEALRTMLDDFLRIVGGAGYFSD